MIGDFKQREVLGSLSPCCVLASPFLPGSRQEQPIAELPPHLLCGQGCGWTQPFGRDSAAPRLRAVADACGRLRTVADGWER